MRNPDGLLNIVFLSKTPIMGISSEYKNGDKHDRSTLGMRNPDGLLNIVFLSKTPIRTKMGISSKYNSNHDKNGDKLPLEIHLK